MQFRCNPHIERALERLLRFASHLVTFASFLVI
jgi:hypothetical protein